MTRIRTNIYRHSIKKRLKSKKFHVFKGTQNIPKLRTLRTKSSLAHHFVYVEKKFKHAGFRFDVLIDYKHESMVNNPRRCVHSMHDIQDALDGERIPTNTYPGLLVRQLASRITIKQDNPTSRIWRKEARFTLLQFILWQNLVYEPYKILTYAFDNRRNCHAWTAFALKMAKTIDKMPWIYP